ncbi:polysaccharide deacetylase family protein [Caulobacter sp. SSI4214]|uniref:polysaccharide deacetylase family protein n=1 Tax=Caulobacter sp. SSI4214 TaxID=2575739 RepID=UPI001438F292|nr:polysaccharide deacetylase family protein [Caulobacter sp. SSI4214]
MLARSPLVFRLALGPELHLWAKAGRTPVLWWRDDDAREPTPALERLLDLSRRHGAPLTVAAVAGPNLASLVRRCQDQPDIEIAVHGFQHINRQPEGQGFGEVVESDSVDWVLDQLQATVTRFHDAGAAPTLFVPPWNNLKPQLITALSETPIRAVSGFAQGVSEADGVSRLDAHLDVLRWKGGARFRGTWRFLARMRKLLAQRRVTGQWSQPIGLLTHHLDHDEDAWRFLDSFMGAFRVEARRGLQLRTLAEPTALSA